LQNVLEGGDVRCFLHRQANEFGKVTHDS